MIIWRKNYGNGNSCFAPELSNAFSIKKSPFINRVKNIRAVELKFCFLSDVCFFKKPFFYKLNLTMTAQDLISVFLLPLKKTDTVAMALNMMEENKVSHLPVVDEPDYLGLISEAQLLGAENDNLKIDNLCSGLPKPAIQEHEHYYYVLNLMTAQRLSVLPVLNRELHYSGLISAERLLVELADALSVRNPGGIMILEINQNDYNLSEIARIVESNDAKILSLSVKTSPNSTKMEITIKLNRLNLEPVIQTFNRYDYVISYYFGENEKNENLLRERYDLLLRYLNT
jgi:acetoin utilization protein AcuB